MSALLTLCAKAGAEAWDAGGGTASGGTSERLKSGRAAASGRCVRASLVLRVASVTEGCDEDAGIARGGTTVRFCEGEPFPVLSRGIFGTLTRLTPIDEGRWLSLASAVDDGDALSGGIFRSVGPLTRPRREVLGGEPPSPELLKSALGPAVASRIGLLG